MHRNKRSNDELKADRPTMSEVQKIPRLPVSVLVENVRSVHNVGAVFRSADGFGAEHVYLAGYTACPPRSDLHKTALGAEESVPWSHHPEPLKLAQTLRDEGLQLVALEQTWESVSIYDVCWRFPVCYVVGNEVTGVSEEMIAVCEKCIEIPMRGLKQSLNVSVAAGIVGYEIGRVYCTMHNA